MRITNIKFALIIMTVLFNVPAFAYSPDETKVECKKPRFSDFNLSEFKAPENIEIPPGAELSFKVSAWVDPKSITLTAKNQPLAFTVESTSTFHKVKAKLPAAFNGSYVRIRASVKALLGCDEQTGWLLKVADK